MYPATEFLALENGCAAAGRAVTQRTMTARAGTRMNTPSKKPQLTSTTENVATASTLLEMSRSADACWTPDAERCHLTRVVFHISDGTPIRHRDFTFENVSTRPRPRADCDVDTSDRFASCGRATERRSVPVERSPASPLAHVDVGVPPGRCRRARLC